MIKTVLAADNIDISPNNGWDSLGNLTFPGLVSGLINLTMVIVALVFFFMLVLGGIKWITSQGDKANVETARNQITNALIGLAIVFAAWAIMRLIGTLFGVDLFNLNIQSFV